MIDPLPKGITGFYAVGTEKPPELSQESFMAVCKALAGHSHKIAGWDVGLEGLLRSFHQAEFSSPPGRRLQLLGSRHYPLLAFAAEGPAEGVDFVFLDPPDSAATVSEPYRLLTRLELEAPVRGVSDSRLRLLPPAELEQVDYWKPARLGDLIFNLWD